MMMWVGRATPQSLLKDIFNVDSVEQIDIKMHVLPTGLGNPTSTKINNIIKYMQTSRSRYPQLQIVRQQLDQFLEAEFSNTFMMEDGKSADSMSYVDYLCFVHR